MSQWDFLFHPEVFNLALIATLADGMKRCRRLMTFRRRSQDERLRLKPKAGSSARPERSCRLALGDLCEGSVATIESADRKDRNYPVASFSLSLFFSTPL